MKTKFYFLAALASIALASCTSDDFVGDNGPNVAQESTTDAINFGFDLQKITRGDIAGPAAATLLGNNFYVTGTKGTEAATYPTPTLVFDNYLVHYSANTAGTTESNTANWEYVGIDQGASTKLPEDYNRVKISSITGAQTIKYWDYSVNQYDFLAFSTGTYKAVSSTNPSESNKEIGVTSMLYGSGLDVASSVPTAYTFTLPSLTAIENAFITDITEVKKSDGFGKEVTLKFKNLGSKVRVALYETVPGYSVKNVKFYRVDGTNADLTTAAKYDNAYLIGADNNSFPTAGTIEVRFPHVGTNYQPGATNAKKDYNKAEATVSPASGTYVKYKEFGSLSSQLVAKDRAEVKEGTTPGTYEAENGKVFLGRTLPTATFAGSSAAAFYETVFPVSTSYPLTLRVDYELVPIDGAKETIKVYGAKAIVPSTYTKWQPNYAYTYIFKISDNTNGWTSTVTTDPSGLFPITFDAVVTEATDATAEQTTVTTVATPSITTYQQNHNYLSANSANEYKKSVGKNIYVQVMDNSTTSASLVTTLSDANSLLYAIDASHAATATEAQVMDALEKRTTALSVTDVTGRNGLTLTKKAIDNSVTTIVNGPDDNPISVNNGEAAMITITGTGTGVLAAGTYAYVYDYSPTTPAKTETTIYQPITASTIPSGTPFITTEDMGKIDVTVTDNITAENESVHSNYLYFTKTTTDGGTTYTYSFVSVDGKTTLPAGLLKVPVGSLKYTTGAVTADSDKFYFDKYIRNNGKYAVKVIKVID